MPTLPVPDDRKPYPHPTLPDVCVVPLTKGRVALIDAADAARVGLFVWAWDPHPTARKNGLALRKSYPSKRAVLLHRYVLDATARKDCVNHGSDDTLDCRRSNLRRFTRGHNAMNVRKQRGRSSVYKGVSWVRKQCVWAAHIRVDGKLRSLGRFQVEATAAEAYDREAAKHFGQFARLNFPGGTLEAA
ncbi:MAG: hypothetical protein JWO31_2008 [Phycisphaerales bacterium]|nr:hypothetical protein [Phycisphaerales bacterium]